jgi:hypothetical protein
LAQQGSEAFRLYFLNKINNIYNINLLVKTLCDIAENILDQENKRALLEEAVALNSYGTALTNYNQANKVFEK